MNDVATSLRLPAAFIQRADTLAERLKDVPELAATGDVNRSKILRLAIAKGLEALEAEHATKKRRGNA